MIFFFFLLQINYEECLFIYSTFLLFFGFQFLLDKTYFQDKVNQEFESFFGDYKTNTTRKLGRDRRIEFCVVFHIIIHNSYVVKFYNMLLQEFYVQNTILKERMLRKVCCAEILFGKYCLIF